MTDIEKKAYVDKHLTKIYPQLKINMEKITGAGKDRWADDLLSVALEFFLNKDIQVQYESCENNKAENFITYMANFQLKSGFSKFYHTHRKFIGKTREYYTDNYQYDSEISHIFVDDDRTVCIKEAMKDLDPFERMLVEERILKGLRYKEIAENYNIPYPSIRDGLKKTLIKIKDRCQHLSKYL